MNHRTRYAIMNVLFLAALTELQVQVNPKYHPKLFPLKSIMPVILCIAKPKTTSLIKSSARTSDKCSKFKVVFSWFSIINQSAYSTLDWVLNSQSDYDWVLYKNRCKFPLHMKIIPMLKCPMIGTNLISSEKQSTALLNSSAKLFYYIIWMNQPLTPY